MVIRPRSYGSGFLVSLFLTVLQSQYVEISGMSFFAVLYLIGGWRDPQRKMREADFAREIIVWLRGLEFTLWFMAYVFAVPVAGYLPTTMVFCAVLSLRAGYRSARMLSAAVALGAVIVVGFKTFLQVRIPGGALYEIFPEALRNFLIVYF